MASEFKEGESIFFAFSNGKTALDSQNKPRMYKTRKQFELKFPSFRMGHVKLVEYAPVVRCKDCKYYVSYWDANCCDIFCDGQEEPYPTNPTDFCSYGERAE